MKKGYIKLLGIELIVLLALFLNIFIFKIYNYYIYCAFWVFILLLIKIFIGFTKDKSLYKVDILQKIFIYCISFLLLTYLSGLFFCFLRSGYALTLKSIFRNAFPILLLIIVEEIFRYVIVSKSDNKKSIMIFMVLIFVIFKGMIGIRSYNLTTGTGIINFAALVILPAIAQNILLTYLAFKSSYKPTILYRIILEIPAYLLPIFPDIGNYFDSITKVGFPMLVFLIFYSNFSKERIVKVGMTKRKKWLLLSPLILLLCLTIGLVSKAFKYYALAIGSGSMEPNIKVGDVVVVKKLKQNELNTLKEGDVLVFRQMNKTVVHRIVTINYENDTYTFITKGDNNNANDNWVLNANQVEGISKVKIPFIGLPSVWLSKKING